MIKTCTTAPRRAWLKFSALITVSLLLTLAGSCAPPPVKAPEAYFYVTPEITYLRDSPGYESNVLGQLYRGDQVARLDESKPGWWRVRSQRSGQVGWIQEELLAAEPVAINYYYAKETTPLRECPREDCASLQLLYRGDQIQKVEENDQGWWRVLVAQDRTLGWVPGAVLTERLEAAPPPKPVKAKSYFYVAVKSLKLRLQPLATAAVVRTLRLNDLVEKLEENPQGWIKVRRPDGDAVGWVVGRYLSASPDEAQAKPYYYVAVPSLRLRLQPSLTAEVVKKLRLNDQVQKLEQDDQGWFKVRQPGSGDLGWVLGRFLKTLPLTAPPLRPGQVKPKAAPAGPPPPEKPQESPVEPEVM